MLLSSVAVASTLALALVQEPAPAAEPAAEAPAETAAEGPAEGPTPAAVAEASSDKESEKETNAVAAPKWKGNGLLIASGVLGGLGLASNIGRIAVVQRACKEVEYDPEEGGVQGTAACRDQGVGLVLLASGAVGFNVAAIGTGAAGGSLHGNWAAHDTAIRNGRQRASGAQIGVGAGLLTLGVLGYVAVRVGSFADALGANSCGEKYGVDSMEPDQANSALADCIRNRWSGYLTGIMLTQAAAVAGTGVLAHGVSYSRNLKLYRSVISHQVRLTPTFTPTWAGMSLSARF
ncbi:MAG: hypothetical protein H0T76_04795 [Nannocystis sp.]|nr:hypothetical protein [Nannocystis sp.]MBA3545782.1 hypothetical protein [Nannocystis sp.]